MCQCKLGLHPEKAKIVYCKRNQGNKLTFSYKIVSFDFLGFTFKPRLVKTKSGKLMRGFTPSISRKGQKKIAVTLRAFRMHRWVHLQLPYIAGQIRAIVRGWINYYGKVNLSGLRFCMRLLNFRLARWARNKFKRFRKKNFYAAYKWLVETSKAYPNMFEHWKYGFLP